MADFKIGDEVYIHGFVDEIRRDIVIIKNEGGYFGTVTEEIIPSAQPEWKKGKWIERNPQNSDKCRLIECDQCGFSHIVGFNVPYEHWIENRNFCERCGADMRKGEGERE